jgi:hypothetical protein
VTTTHYIPAIFGLSRAEQERISCERAELRLTCDQLAVRVIVTSVRHDYNRTHYSGTVEAGEAFSPLALAVLVAGSLDFGGTLKINRHVDGSAHFDLSVSGSD